MSTRGEPLGATVAAAEFDFQCAGPDYLRRTKRAEDQLHAAHRYRVVSRIRNTSVRCGFAMANDVIYDNLGCCRRLRRCSRPATRLRRHGHDANSQACSGRSEPASWLLVDCRPFREPPITDPTKARSSTSGYIPNQTLPYSETLTLGIQHIFAKKYTLKFAT